MGDTMAKIMVLSFSDKEDTYQRMLQVVSNSKNFVERNGGLLSRSGYSYAILGGSVHPKYWLSGVEIPHK